MRNLTRVVADANASVIGGGTKPGRSMLRALIQYCPKPNVMALFGTAAYWFLEREILTAAVVKEIADRGIRVRPVEHNALGDLHACPERDRIGWIPPRQSPCT